MNAPDPLTVHVVFDADKFQADLRDAIKLAVGSVLQDVDKYFRAEESNAIQLPRCTTPNNGGDCAPGGTCAACGRTM